jgi:nucleoside-diphosphate-sugar epimerase
VLRKNYIVQLSQMKKIVITGATGLIGLAIIEYAIKQNCEVICLINPNSSRNSKIPQHPLVHIENCGHSDYQSFSPKTADCDVFFHLAWGNTFGASRDNVPSQIQNIQYTLDAVNLAQRMGCSVFVGAGSQAEYGIVDKPLTPYTPCFPTSGYGIAKHAAGLLAQLHCQQLNMRCNWVRILSVYGKNDGAHTLISYLIEELSNNRKPALTLCEQQWDYLHSDDAGCALWSVGENGKEGKTYVLGSGQGKSLHKYVETIYCLTNATCGLGFGEKPYYPHQPMYLVADISELTKDTGWVPEISFEEGILKIFY